MRCGDVGTSEGSAFSAESTSPGFGLPDTARVGAGRPAAGGGGLPLRPLTVTQDCAGLGSLGRVSMRLGGDIVPAAFHDSVNLKTYWRAS